MRTCPCHTKWEQCDIECARAPLGEQCSLRVVAADLSAGDGRLGAELFRGRCHLRNEALDRFNAATASLAISRILAWLGTGNDRYWAHCVETQPSPPRQFR